MTEAHSGYRLLHTMIRVGDLDRSLDFYQRLLRTERPDYVFVGYGDERSDAVIELTYNSGGALREGNGWGHLAIPTSTRPASAERGTASPSPGRPGLKHGTVIAFIVDPDGYDRADPATIDDRFGFLPVSDLPPTWRSSRAAAPR